MSFHIDYLKDCIWAGIQYIPVTLKMTVIIFVVSCIIGLLVATLRFYKVPVVSQCLAGFITIYLGVPIMLAINVYYLMFSTFYTPVMNFLHLSRTIRDANFNLVAYFTMIMSMSCMFSEIFRGAYRAIDKLQFEAGYSIGLTEFKTLTRVIFPQMIPVILPSMINSLTATLKNMSMVSIIGIYEVLNGSLVPCVKTYSYVEGYVAAALIYWAMVVIIEQIGKRVEKNSGKFRRLAA